MKHTSINSLLRRSALVLALLGLLAGTASAQTATTYNLVVDEFDLDGVPMWGYKFETDPAHVCGTPGAWAPGPTLRTVEGVGLDITVKNCLTERVSLVIPGQPLKGAPEPPTGRVTSFTTSVGQTDPVTYSWGPGELKAGTYLYNSGTKPAKQVHMGLYGALVVDVVYGTAYAGIDYDRDIVVLYSEVDPALHADTVPDDLGDPLTLRTQPSTAQALNFKPKTFLVNGSDAGDTVLTGGTPAPLNSRVLLRFVNAGLKAYVPTMLGEDLEWVAEDGNKYPFSTKSYSAFLGAGKTMDAIWVPVTQDRHALYDRRMHMSDNGEAGGGMRAFLDSGYVDLPIADAGGDHVHVALGTPITFNGSATDGTGPYTAWDWTLVAFPEGSTAGLVPDTVDPSIARITPDVPGTYSAQLVVTDSTIPTALTSAPAIANVFTNLPPVAVAGPDQVVEAGDQVDLDGRLSYDPDSDVYLDTITFSWALTTVPAGSGATVTPESCVGGLCEDSNLVCTADADCPAASFTADLDGLYSAELTVFDGELDGTDVLYVTANVPVHEPPNAVDDFVSYVERNSTGYIIRVDNNDSDGSSLRDFSTIAVVTLPKKGSTAVAAFDGTGYWFAYTPKFGWTGSDYFTYSICDAIGVCSEAQVQINVVRP